MVANTLYTAIIVLLEGLHFDPYIGPIFSYDLSETLISSCSLVSEQIMLKYIIMLMKGRKFFFYYTAFLLKERGFISL